MVIIYAIAQFDYFAGTLPVFLEEKQGLLAPSQTKSRQAA
jgi:hypothetical protein